MERGATAPLSDRPLRHTDPWGNSVSHTYDAQGNRLSTTAQGVSVHYQADALNRRAGLIAPGGAIAFSHDRSSRPTAVLHPDGSQSSTTYDAAGRVSAVEHRLNGSLIAKSQTTHDANGNRLAETTQEATQTRSTDYRYDADDRLVGETRNDPAGRLVTDWTLDPAGNRIGETLVGSGAYANQSRHRQISLNPRGQITAIDQSGNDPGHHQYQHDPDGHLTRVQAPGRDTTYTWNSAGQLVEARINGQRQGQYRYTPDGLREEKITPGQIRRSQWIDGQAALDRDDAGNPQGRYEGQPGRPPVLLLHPQGNEQLHADALGSITHSTAGALLASRQYDAWGNASPSGSSRNKFGYTGHLPDDETGLIYFQARYYDPSLGRFLSEDAKAGDNTLPVSWAAYLYANGNPLVYVDKDGNVPILAEGADALGQFNHWLRQRAAGYGDGKVGIAGNLATGVTRGIVAGAEGALRLANIAANTAIVAAGGLGSERLQEASADELGRSVEAAAKAYDYLAHQGGGQALAAKAIDTVRRAAEGEGRAVGDLTEFGVGLMGGGQGLGATAKGVKAAAGTAEVAAAKAAEVARGAARRIEGVLTKEGGKMEIAGQPLPAQKGVPAVSGGGEEAALRLRQVRAAGQVTADVANEAGAASRQSGFIFRGDARSPEVIFEQGFQPRGTNQDLLLYAQQNEPSIFVSTSKSPTVAREFADMQGDGYVYSIRGQTQGLDVNAMLGAKSPFPHELEVAVPGGVKSVDIMGARLVGSDGKFIGPFIKNPAYGPQ